MTAPRRLQLRRGNSTAISSYTGAAGELVVNTTNWTLYVHDGVTVGGYAATVNTASISGNINSILNGTAVFGNLIPSANVIYSLGNITHQWNDLFVSNNTIFVGGVPLTIDATGNLRINGNIIPTIGYVNTVVANVTVDLSSYALNANVTAANVGLKGYVDQANTIQSAQLTSANLGIIGYIDQANTIQSAQISAANLGMQGYVDQANTIQSAQVNAANLAITAANVGMKGYVDASIGNIAPAYSNANVASYLPTYSGNIGANISKAGYTWTFGADGTLTLPGPNPGIYASDNSTIYTNYLATTTLSTAQINGTNAGNHLIIQTNNLWSWQFNSDGSTAFPGNVTIEGNLFVNGNVNYISVNNLAIGDNIINLADLNPADSLDLGLTAHRTVNSLLQHTGLIRDASANQWRLFSNVVQNPGTTVDFTDAIYDDLQLGNITSPTITAINNNIAAANAAWAFANTIQSQQLAAANIGIIGYIDLANTIQSAQITAANVGIIGYIDRANTIQSAQITAANVGIIGYIDLGNTIQAAAITSANVGMKGYVDFANTIMKAYVDGQIIAANANVSTSGGGSNYSNANVASYLPTHTGNVGVNYLLGTTPNVTVTAGTFNSIFDTTGNVVLPTAYVAGNVTANYFIGNGALLTGIVASGSSGTNYSNVNVQAYTETMGFRNYSNVNVAAYLNTQGYNLYSNANVASYLPTYSGNVRALNFIGAIQAQVGSSFAYAQDAFGATSDTGSVFLPADANSNAIVAGYTIVGNSGAVTLTVTSASFVAGTPNFVQVNTSPSPVVFTYPVTVYTANYSPALPLSTITVGNAIVSGNVSAQYLFGNGAFLTGIVVSSGGTNYSNVNVKAYTETMGFQNYGNVNVAALITTNGLTNYSNVNTAAYLNSQGYNLYSNVNVASYLSTATINTTGNITAAYLTGNINITGNVTGTSPNVTIQAGSFSSVFDNQGNVTVPRLFTAGNIQTAGYLFGNGAFLTGVVTGSSYGNAQVATYLQVGNIANISVAGNVTATYFLGNGALLTGIASSYSNVQVATYLPTYTGVITASNVAVNGNVTAQFLFGNGSQLTGLPSSYSNVNVATYLPTYSGNVANIRLGVSGVLTFADGTTQVTAGGGSYSNVQVATYLPTYTGSLNASNILVTSANITIANIQATTAATNPATGALRVMGGVGVAGAVVAGQLNTTGNLIANAVSAYSLNTVANVVASVVNAGTINSSGNVLAQNLIGTIATASQPSITAVGTLATLSVTGNATVGNLVGSEANTRIIANTYVTTFDIYGNVTFPGNVIAPYFVGDGSRLTGIVSGGGSSYGNSNVAQYLPTYSGNIANIRLGSSGVLTFADGTTQITAGGGSYSNVQVATYLPTYSGNIGNVSTTSNIVTSNQIISTRSGSAIRAENGSIFAGQNGTFVNAVLTNALNPYTGSNISLSSIYNFSDVNNIWSLGNIVTNGNVSAGNLSATGNITATGYIVTTGGFGNITQVDYITANNVVATANVTVQGIGVTMPNRPAFRVNGTALYGGAQSTANVNLRGVAVSTVYNQGSYFNATTGLFTAPIAGIYEVLLNARVNSSFNSLAQLVVLKNGLNTSGNIVAFWETTSNIGGATHFGVSGTVVLATGDYLSANILAGNVTFDANDNWSVTYLG